VPPSALIPVFFLMVFLFMILHLVVIHFFMITFFMIHHLVMILLFMIHHLVVVHVFVVHHLVMVHLFVVHHLVAIAGVIKKTTAKRAAERYPENFIFFFILISFCLWRVTAFFVFNNYINPVLISALVLTPWYLINGREQCAFTPLAGLYLNGMLYVGYKDHSIAFVTGIGGLRRPLSLR